MVEQFPGHAAVEVFLAGTHPSKTLQALPVGEGEKGEEDEDAAPDVHAAHGEVAVAHVELPVDCQADLPLQCGRDL